MKLGIDMDGVMCDFIRSFTQLAKDMGLTDHAWDCKDQQAWEFPFEDGPVWREITRRYNWWMTVVPAVSYDDVEYLNAIIRKHDVYFITSRHATAGFSAEKQSELWLQSIDVASHHANILTAKAGNKGPLCKALGITDMIDDHVPNLEDLSSNGIKAWCRDWPYNALWLGPRVDSLYEFLFKVIE